MTTAGSNTEASASPESPDLRRLHERAARRLAENVGRIRPDQWHLPTPCSEWDLRTLVDHVVRWNGLVPEFMAGRTMQEMPDLLTRDVLGADPAASAERSAAEAIAAFAAPDALQRLIHHPFGEYSGAQFLFLRLFDNAIHGWDLLRALGLQEAPDDEITALLWAGSIAQREPLRASGHFGPAEVPVPDGADLQTRLLGLLGRRA